MWLKFETATRTFVIKDSEIYTLLWDKDTLEVKLDITNGSFIVECKYEELLNLVTPANNPYYCSPLVLFPIKNGAIFVNIQKLRYYKYSKERQYVSLEFPKAEIFLTSTELTTEQFEQFITALDKHCCSEVNIETALFHSHDLDGNLTI